MKNELNCAICKSLKIKSLGNYSPRDFKLDNKLPYFKCLDCGHVFSADNPTVELLTQFYNYKFKDGNYQDYTTYHLDKNVEFNNIINKYIKPYLSLESKILEIGCGEGFFLSSLLTNGYNKLFGYDISDYIISKARSRLPKNVTLYDSLNYDLSQILEVDKYDAIFAFDVIEHIYDPRVYINNIYKGLKKEGRILFTTPSADSIANKILGERWPYFLPLEHLNIFSNESMKRILTDVGFKEISLKNKKRFFSLSYGIASLESIYSLNGNLWKIFKYIIKVISKVFKGVNINLGLMICT